MVIDEFDLLLFDVDGTIAERNGRSLFAEARDFFRLLEGMGGTLPVGLVTNQGGVALRMWMEDAPFGDPARLPTLEDVNARLKLLVEQIPVPTRLYVSYAYQTQNTRQWAPVPHQYAGYLEWSRSWRKPQAGMIRQAMADARVSIPDRVLLVGDRDTDKGAAMKAGIKFMWVRPFWGQVPKFMGLEETTR